MSRSLCFLGDKCSFKNLKLFLIEAKRSLFYEPVLNEIWTDSKNELVMLLWMYEQLFYKEKKELSVTIQLATGRGPGQHNSYFTVIHLDELVYLVTTTTLGFRFTFTFVWWNEAMKLYKQRKGRRSILKQKGQPTSIWTYPLTWQSSEVLLWLSPLGCSIWVVQYF